MAVASVALSFLVGKLALSSTQHLLSPCEEVVSPRMALSSGQPSGICAKGGAMHCPGQDGDYCTLLVGMTRLRKRALWARRLESRLGLGFCSLGAFFRGRWQPDLVSKEHNPAVAQLLLYFRHGAKCLGGGIVQPQDKRKGESDAEYSARCDQATYLVMEFPDGSREIVYPDLFFKLASYTFCRKRDALLVPAIRVRALDWCKKVGLTEVDTWIAVSSVIHLVWQISAKELMSRAAICREDSTSAWWST